MRSQPRSLQHRHLRPRGWQAADAWGWNSGTSLLRWELKGLIVSAEIAAIAASLLWLKQTIIQGVHITNPIFSLKKNFDLRRKRSSSQNGTSPTIIVYTKSPVVVGWVVWYWFSLFLFCVALIIILCIVMKWGYYEKLILKNKNWGRKGASLFYPFIKFFFLIYIYIYILYIERESCLIFCWGDGGFNWKFCNITIWCLVCQSLTILLPFVIVIWRKIWEKNEWMKSFWLIIFLFN